MDEADKSMQAYEELYNSIPSIGFLSQKKRIAAYRKVTGLLQKMIDEQEVSEENAIFLLSILVRKSSDFQKATMMVALNLPKIDKKILQPVAFKYANEFRCSLQMFPVDEDETNGVG